MVHGAKFWLVQGINHIHFAVNIFHDDKGARSEGASPLSPGLLQAEPVSELIRKPAAMFDDGIPNSSHCHAASAVAL